jgi:hypothetical protein
MITTSEAPAFTAFLGERLLAKGPLHEVLTAAKAVFDKGLDADLLFIDEASGRSRDFDLRGDLSYVLQAALPAPPPRGPGRPKLGVQSREITLLPRHWDWLDQAPQGASAALRRLVEEARQREPNKAEARRVREATDRAMATLGGDRAGYEEATRALYAKDLPRFKAQIKGWPSDLRRYLTQRMERAAALEEGA